MTVRAIVVLAVLSIPTGDATVAGQPPTPSPVGSAPRTPWGAPDLRGPWTNATTTPMVRPDEFADREFLTQEEWAVRNPGSGISTEDLTALMPTGAYNDFWLEKGELSLRTSLLVDSPDGKYPSLTPEAMRRRGEVRSSFAQDGFETWLDFSTYDRCLTRGLPGAMSPGFYNHNYQILQTPDYVTILVRDDEPPRIGPGHCRAVHAGRRRDDRLPDHGLRSCSVDRPVDGGDSDASGRRAALRIRLSRRQPFGAEYADRLSGRGCVLTSSLPECRTGSRPQPWRC